MRFAIVPLLTAALLMNPLSLAAQSLSYSYLDIGYVGSEIDSLAGLRNFDEHFDGVGVGASFELTGGLFAFGNYLYQSAGDVCIYTNDLYCDSLDVSTYNLGLGYAWPLHDNLDIYGKAAYVSAETDYLSRGVSDDGYALGIGLRGRASENIELEGAVSWVELSEGDGEAGFGLAMRWFLAEHFAIAVEGGVADNSISYGLGIRWDWGRRSAADSRAPSKAAPPVNSQPVSSTAYAGAGAAMGSQTQGPGTAFLGKNDFTVRQITREIGCEAPELLEQSASMETFRVDCGDGQYKTIQCEFTNCKVTQ